MSGKTIWIVNQDASFLEARSLSMSKVFAVSGYFPVIITASFHHGSKQYLYNDPITFTEPFTGVKRVFLKASPAYYSNIQRVLNMIDFCRKFRHYEKLIAEQTGKPDFIVASMDNHFLPEVAYKSAKRFGAKFITELRDIWPLTKP